MSHQHVRINIQLMSELKEAIGEVARARGESVSEFLRRGAEERLDRLRKEEQERRLAEGYRHMAREHKAESAGWESVALEGWES